MGELQLHCRGEAQALVRGMRSSPWGAMNSLGLVQMYVAWDYPGQGPSTYGFAAADTPRDVNKAWGVSLQLHADRSLWQMLLEEMEEKGIKRFKGKEHFLRVWL